MNNENEWQEREKQSYVFIDSEEVLLSKCDFLNVEEDGLTGRDLVTFVFNGIERKSFVVVK